jgi:hypothetical protein
MFLFYKLVAHICTDLQLNFKLGKVLGSQLAMGLQLVFECGTHERSYKFHSRLPISNQQGKTLKPITTNQLSSNLKSYLEYFQCKLQS